MDLKLCFRAGLLAIESNEVIQLRMWRVFAGGAEAFEECVLMVREKAEAAHEASRNLAQGGSLLSVVERYRGHVAANAHRLKAEFPGGVDAGGPQRARL